MRQTTTLFILLLLGWLNAALAESVQWRSLAPGLDYTQLPLEDGRIHAFRIDLAHYQLESAFARDYQKTAASAEELANQSHALIAINGGFFSPDYQPLGLRISGHQIQNPLKQTPWWGIFSIQNRQAKIMALRDYIPNASISFAVQAGPRLLVNKQMPPLKEGIAERSALCITKNNQVILMATDNSPVTTALLAQKIRAPASAGGLDCINALNLDGGSSSQLYAHIGPFELDIPNFGIVSDAIIVKPRP